MTLAHSSRSVPLIRLVCLLVCYSLVSPFIALMPVNGVLAGSVSLREGANNETTRPPKATSLSQVVRWRERELLVRFKHDVAESDIDALLRSSGLQRARRLRGHSGMELLHLQANVDPEAVASKIRSGNLVDFAEPNFLITADQVSPDDPRFSEQWGLNNSLSRDGQVGSDINAEQAWELSTGSPGTIVAVIDSGIDFTHPDLRNNEWNNSLEQGNRNRDNDDNGYLNDLHGWDFVTDANEIKDEQGHGTAVAGIIAAEGNNATGMTGVMWRAALMSLRVLNRDGVGDVARAVEAIDYAVDNGAQVINCSWGTDDGSIALLEAINAASRKGVVVVSSAGNNSRDVETTPRFPASFDLSNLISVGSTDESDLLAPSSNWGATHVTIAAPGENILTTKLGGDYQTVSGSSFSAPFVTGVVGLVKSVRPWLNTPETREAIVRGSRQVPSLAGKVSGKGVVNAKGTFEALQTLSPTEGREANPDINGGEHGNNGNGRRNPHDNPPGNGTRPGGGREFGVTPPARTQGAPGWGLPNLDDLRHKQPTNPKAADPVPSSRCSPRDPDCSSDRPRASLDSPPDLLAWGANTQGFASLFGNADTSISDSPFRIFSIPRPLLVGMMPQATRGNVALAANGSTASASSTYAGYAYTPGGAINGEHNGVNQQNGGVWHSATNTFPQWLQIDFNGSKSIDEIDVYTLQDNYTNPSEPTEATTFSLYGLTGYEVQFWNGTSWVNVPGGSVTGNNKVWKKLPFSSITTSKIRVLTNAAVDGYSRITEVEAWGTEAPPRTNVALSSNGGVASASSSYQGGYTANHTNNGDRRGVTYWNDAAPANSFPDWLQIDFQSSKSIDEIDVFGLQDNYSTPAEPTEAMTFTLYGLTAFEVQYWNGTSWTNVPGGAVTGNNNVWRKFTFSPIATTKIRVQVSAAPDGYSRLAEVEAWETVASPRSNLALATNGAVASASSQYDGNYPPSGANNDDRKGQPPTSGGVWNDAAPSNTFPDWLQIDFQGNKTIDEIDVFTLQDNYTNPSEPTETMTFSLYGLTGYEVQYWNGTSWLNVPGGSVTANNKVWKKLTFAAITTSKIRVLTNAAVDGYSRITELEAWGTTGPSSDPSGNNYSMSRLDPSNRTGSGTVNLLSGNANWSLPILGLKGRAGLDLGLSLSYNSLVWTKDAASNSIKFDADRGMPSPGFRLGFPVIQGPYYNSQGKNAYLMVSPSGAHVELRQVGMSNFYDSEDSSYLRFDNSSLTLRPTDGSQLRYELKNGQYVCNESKDRNGNFITISHHVDGRINTVTDTLGREVTFNYDTYLNLISITQDWGGVTHKWATFGWSNLTIQTSFSNLNVVGPQNGTTIPVLTSVGLGDTTYYKFRYTSLGQVDKVTYYAADSVQNGQMMDTHPLNYTLFTLPASSTDCPRVTEQKVWVENWNNNLEATTSYSTATNYSSGQMTAPDGTIYKELFATSGWQKGLTTGTEIKSGGAVKKSTTTTFTQNDTNLTYQKNPRVIETNVSDQQGNNRRTVIEYGTTDSDNEKWGLPSRVVEYAANGTTEIRHTFTGYNFDPEYINRRIIGLVSAVHVSDTQNWASIVYFDYDAGGSQLVATPNSTVGHDNSYDTSQAAKWRGNLTSVTRYDVTAINDASKRSVTQIGYNTNGSVVFSRDPSDHLSNISYADSFSDGNNTRNTYAYPTAVTDPDNYSSTMQYRYDFGAVTRTQSPAPAGQPQGRIQTFEYDTAGRPSRIDTVNNGAYRRWVYDPYGYVSVFDTGNTTSQEAYSTVVYDGAGRVRAKGGDNPNSTGGYRGQFTLYDVMGRVSQTSNPTEITGAWAPTGDDASGWVWTQQAYDWKGRPTVTTNPDGTTKEATYGGCGCAGGEVVTVWDEVGRRQRMTADVLGRSAKIEQLNWDESVYSTIINTYNARDQITNSKHYQGTETSGVFQESTMTYDGHGRLATSHAPEQRDQSNQPLSTSYTYNADDTTAVVTDARGATTTFAHNNRHLITSLTFTAPSGVTNTASVSISYDAAGNRTNMTDGVGSVSYNYDQLSRLTSETRSFTGVGSFSLNYGYNLAGALTSITDPWGVQVGYNYDHTGRLTAVTGSGGGASTYASNMQYRAWGALKHLAYGNNLNLDLTYNDRLQSTKYDLVNPGSGVRVMGREYQYTTTPTSTDNDGRVKYSHDLVASNLDRTYNYDHTGQLQSAKAGVLQSGYSYYTGPFEQSYSYDVWGNMTGRSWRTFASYGGYTYPQPNGYSEYYVNNRNTTTGWQYDLDGNVSSATADGVTRQYTYDAAGFMLTLSEPGKNITQAFDGDGERVTFIENGATTLYVRSSVLAGQVITEVDQSGVKKRGYVYSGSEIIAKQENGQVFWEQSDPTESSNRTTDGAGTVTSKVETDPLGTKVDDTANYNYSGQTAYNSNPMGFYGAGNQSQMCAVRELGVALPCSMLNRRTLAWGIGILDITLGRRSQQKPQLRQATNMNGARLIPRQNPINYYVDNREVEHLVYYLSFGFQQQNYQQKITDGTNKAKALAVGDCQKFIEELLFQAFLKKENINPTSLSIAETQAIKQGNPVKSIFDALAKATPYIRATERAADGARAKAHWQGDQRSVDYYQDFFGQAYNNDIRINNDPKTYFDDRNNIERAQSLLHESLHLVDSAFSDAFLGEILDGKTYKGSDKEKRDKGSKALNREIQKHCGGNQRT